MGKLREFKLAEINQMINEVKKHKQGASVNSAKSTAMTLNPILVITLLSPYSGNEMGSMCQINHCYNSILFPSLEKIYSSVWDKIQMSEETNSD